MTKETIIKHFADNYKQWQKFARNIAGDDCDDLLQEVSLMILEMPEERLRAAWNEKEGLKPFILRIMTNQYRSTTSKFHKEYRKLNQFVNQRGQEVTYHSTQEDIEEPEIDSERLRAITANMAALNMRLFDEPIDLLIWGAYVETGSLRKAVEYLNRNKLSTEAEFDLKAVHEVVRRMRDTYREGLKAQPKPRSLREKGEIRTMQIKRGAA
jgi:hypothetical protein